LNGNFVGEDNESDVPKIVLYFDFDFFSTQTTSEKYSIELLGRWWCCCISHRN